VLSSRWIRSVTTVGFAQFEVSAKNPPGAIYELDAQELADVATLLGHPVTQVLAHY
jgi:hypothetical protein